ncbi:Prophage CP4-57 integrase [Cedecea neteri]|uniref:Prophage CP4-57 integrase n=1 Tax=Cedecea neteri TaxID=158822 RepID=A0A2X3KSZ2_9ENTR|nr:Prophage CP4-57 integrase [Cedecea neteri]
MPLTDTKVKNAKPLEKEYKLTDGFGMFLRVTPRVPNTGKWLTASKESKTFLYWCLPCCSLADARQRRDEARRLLAQGIDPNAKKQAEVKELKAKRDKTCTFTVVAKAWFATKTKWSEDYGDSVWKRLETYVFPAIGDKDVAELDTGDLLVPVKKVEALAILKLPCAFNNTLRRSSVMLSSKS